jgi:hypothetical protein
VVAEALDRSLEMVALVTHHQLLHHKEATVVQEIIPQTAKTQVVEVGAHPLQERTVTMNLLVQVVMGLRAA